MNILNKKKNQVSPQLSNELLSLESPSEEVQEIVTETSPEEVVKEETITSHLTSIDQEETPIEETSIFLENSNTFDTPTSVFVKEEDIEIERIEKSIESPIVQVGKEQPKEEVIVKTKEVKRVYSFSFMNGEEEVTLYSEGCPIFVKDNEEDGIQFSRVFKKITLNENILNTVKASLSFKETIPDTLFIPLSSGIFIKTIVEEAWMNVNRELAEPKFNKRILEQYRRVSEEIIASSSKQTVIAKRTTNVNPSQREVLGEL